jgi:hypothetical protein
VNAIESKPAEPCAPVSAFAAYVLRRAAFLATYHRPCLCDGDGPLDLRAGEPGRGIVCARCDRPWTPREVSR